MYKCTNITIEGGIINAKGGLSSAGIGTDYWTKDTQEGSGTITISGGTITATGGTYGTVQLTDNAETLFTPSTIGNCRYQLPGDAAWAAAMLDRIRTFNKMRVNR